MATIPSTLAW
ncbi:unnamed protein product, partial [Rotaria sp. Silwood2]